MINLNAKNVGVNIFQIKKEQASDERVQIWVLWARVTNENVKETIKNTNYI